MTSGPGSSPGREVVELRIHGVHGTSPASMLGVDQGDVRQVAGDNLTGLYRSRSGKLPYRDVSGDDTTVQDISVEAYSWGALTSGVRGFLGWLQRALWLVLLPFALANLAYWARLQLDGSKPSARWGARLSRLGALLLTVFLVLTPCLIGIDLIAWQCYRGGSPGCSTLPGMLDFLARLTPGQRLAVGSLMPLFFVAVLWFLSRISMLRYEEVRYDEADLGSSPMVLRHPSLWQGKARTEQLQRGHLAIALAVVVAFSGVHVVKYHDGPEPVVWAGLVLSGVSALAVALWTATIHPHDVEYDGVQGRMVDLRRSLVRSTEVRRRVRERLPAVVFAVMVLVTLTHLAALWLLPTDPKHGVLLTQRADFFGHNLWFLGVFVALTTVHVSVFTIERMSRAAAVGSALLVVTLGGCTLLLSLGRSPDSWHVGWVLLGVAFLFALALTVRHVSLRHRFAQQAWAGAGASVLLAASAWVALLFTTGAVTATANYLNGADHGVEDLVSQLGDDSDSLAPAAVGHARKGTTFVATGDVVLRDAVVTYRGGSPRGAPLLRSGTVESERLYDAKQKLVSDLRHVALQKGEVGIHRARLVIDADSVRLDGSCVRLSVTVACTAESSRFLAGGTLHLKKAVLQIRSPDGVRLVPANRPAVPLVVPQVLIWAPLAQTIWLVLTLAWVALAFGWVRHRTRRAVAEQVRADRITARDRQAAAKARSRAVFAHRAERVIDVLGSYTSALIVLLIIASCQGKAPWMIAEWLRPFATAGMYVAVGLGLALVMVFSRVRTSENARRAVGVLWDLTTFWPRAAHPLAPPCYAERVVPEILTRIDWVLHFTDQEGHQHRGDNLLILSAHSQGSVIACAALSRMEDSEVARTRVITYGSQIRP